MLFGRSNDTPAVADPLRPADSHTLSQAPDTKVTVVEFLDFQCPACAYYYTNVTKKLEQDYQGRVTFVPRNFPMSNVHPLAIPAARAAEAAGKQGKYVEMYHALYDGYPRWALAADRKSPSDDHTRATATFEQFATQLGLDLDRFRADQAAADVQATIDRGFADGRKLGVTGTPAFFVNGQQFHSQGTQIADIDRELRKEIDTRLAAP
jgi:protein-disulfide isomerase